MERLIFSDQSQRILIATVALTLCGTALVQISNHADRPRLTLARTTKDDLGAFRWLEPRIVSDLLQLQRELADHFAQSNKYPDSWHDLGINVHNFYLYGPPRDRVTPLRLSQQHVSYRYRKLPRVGYRVEVLNFLGKIQFVLTPKTGEAQIHKFAKSFEKANAEPDSVNGQRLGKLYTEIYAHADDLDLACLRLLIEFKESLRNFQQNHNRLPNSLNELGLHFVSAMNHADAPELYELERNWVTDRKATRWKPPGDRYILELERTPKSCSLYAVDRKNTKVAKASAQLAQVEIVSSFCKYLIDRNKRDNGFNKIKFAFESIDEEIAGSSESIERNSIALERVNDFCRRIHSALKEFFKRKKRFQDSWTQLFGECPARELGLPSLPKQVSYSCNRRVWRPAGYPFTVSIEFVNSKQILLQIPLNDYGPLLSLSIDEEALKDNVCKPFCHGSTNIAYSGAEVDHRVSFAIYQAQFKFYSKFHYFASHWLELSKYMDRAFAKELPTQAGQRHWQPKQSQLSYAIGFANCDRFFVYTKDKSGDFVFTFQDRFAKGFPHTPMSRYWPIRVETRLKLVTAQQ